MAAMHEIGLHITTWQPLPSPSLPSNRSEHCSARTPPPSTAAANNPRSFFESNCDALRNFALVNWLFRQKLTDSKSDMNRETVLESMKY